MCTRVYDFCGYSDVGGCVDRDLRVLASVGMPSAGSGARMDRKFFLSVLANPTCGKSADTQDFRYTKCKGLRC